MNRSKLRHSSKKTARPVESHRDCHGLPFDEVPLRMPQRVSDWPKSNIVTDPTICANMHEWFHTCWNCGAPNPQAHHIAGGAMRSDEYTNVAMLCGPDMRTGAEGCHAKADTPELPTERILYLKWKHDRQHTNWIRLFQLLRRFFSELMTAKPKVGAKP